MSRGGRSPDQRREQALRECQKKEGNKVCADCTERLPQSIVTNFNTFVCTPCSGIHREFSHRVKSISLSSFTDEEVEAVKKGGNNVNNALYMARHRRGSDLPEPEGGRPDKHREFIRAKYIDKRWFATPDDLQRDAEREAGRGLGRGKRESERKKSLTPKSRRNRDAGGSTPPRPRRSDQVSVRDPPGETTKTPPAPTPTVNLLDFLTDDPVPVADPTPAAPRPPTLTYQQQQLPQHQHPPWNAFGPDLTSTDAIAPPPQPQLLLTVELAPGPSRGFAPPPAGAGVAQNWATFENSPAAVVVPTQNLPGGFHSGFNVSVANARVDGGGGLSVGDRFEDNCLTAKFANSFSMSGSPRPGKINNPPAPVQPQQQQQQTFFSPSPSLQDSQQSGAPSGYSTPGTPGPPPQQQQQQTEYSSRSRRAQDLSPRTASNGGVGLGLAAATSSSEVTSLVTPQQQQQIGSPYPAQHQQHQQPTQGVYNPAASSQQGFPAFKPQAPRAQPHQHQVGTYGPPYGVSGNFSANFSAGASSSSENPQRQQFYAQHQQPQQQHPWYRVTAAPQYQQQQYHHHQQRSGGTPRGLSPSSVVASTTSDDPFAELTEGGDRGSKGHGQGDPEPQYFKKGDEVLYVKRKESPLEGVIGAVHFDAGDPPFYTFLVKTTGQEKNVKHEHLQRKEQAGAATNDIGNQSSQQRAASDAFASIEAVPWTSALRPQQHQPPQQQQQQQQGPPVPAEHTVAAAQQQMRPPSQQQQQQDYVQIGPPVPPKPKNTSMQQQQRDHVQQGPPLPPKPRNTTMQHRQPTANAQGNGLDNGGGEFLGGKRPTEGAGSNPFDGEWEATPAVAAVPGLGPMFGGNPFDNFNM